MPTRAPSRPDADRPAHDEIDGTHLARRHGPPVAARAGDAGRERGALPEPLRVDLDEALLGAQARDRHVDDLALFEREATDRQLRRVGIHLDHERAPPDGHLAQQLRRLLGADEVRDATGRAGEAADGLPLNRFQTFWRISAFVIVHRSCGAVGVQLLGTKGVPGSQF